MIATQTQAVTLPTAEQASARIANAQRAIDDHLARIDALESRLAETKKQGQVAAPGSPARRSAGTQIASLTAELEFETNDRPDLDKELSLAKRDVWIVERLEPSMREAHDLLAANKAAKRRLEAAQIELSTAQKAAQQVNSDWLHAQGRAESAANTLHQFDPDPHVSRYVTAINAILESEE